jgi:hypothetical protein
MLHSLQSDNEKITLRAAYHLLCQSVLHYRHAVSAIDVDLIVLRTILPQSACFLTRV